MARLLVALNGLALALPALAKPGVPASALVVAVVLGLWASQPGVAAWSVGAPIVTYWNYSGPPLTDEVARRAVDGGYNLVTIYTLDELKVAERFGLRAQLDPSGPRGELESPLSAASLDDPVKLDQLNSLIDQFKASPAAYSYYMADEPNAARFRDLGRIVNHLRQRDPEHMAYVNLLPTYASNGALGTTGDTVVAYNSYLSQYVDAVQPSLLSYDHYHLMQASDGTPIDASQYFLNLALVGKASRQTGAPFVNVVQVGAWEPSVRVPTGDEMRFLVYTTLAYGAQGISYFNYTLNYTTSAGELVEGGLVDHAGALTPIYNALAPLNREFVAIAAKVQPLHSLGAYHLGDEPPGAARLPGDSPFAVVPRPDNTTYVDGQPVEGMLLGLFGPDNQLSNATCALVVNLDYNASVTTTVNGPGDLSTFNAVTNQWTPTGRHSATLTLAPGGGVLVGLTSAVQAPEPSSSKLLGIGLIGALACVWRRRDRFGIRVSQSLR